MKNYQLFVAGAVALMLAATAYAGTGSSHKKMMAQAKVSEAAARSTALTQVPQGEVTSAELEREHGKLIWSFDIKQPDTPDIREIQVSAITGKVVSAQTETAAKEAKEAVAERREAGKR